MRPSKDTYYMNIAKEVASRSTCLMVDIGAVIVRDDQIISTGYVGAPRGTKSSLEHGFCLRRKLDIPSGQRYELCRSVHAEQNVIINAARAGVSLLGGSLYLYGVRKDGTPIDTFPCFICKKIIINAGLERVVCQTTKGIETFFVSDWVEEWKNNEIIDDKNQFSNKYESEFLQTIGKTPEE